MGQGAHRHDIHSAGGQRGDVVPVHPARYFHQRPAVDPAHGVKLVREGQEVELPRFDQDEIVKAFSAG